MAKEKIPEELGLALVLTVYEAKGLEFDDVLLYNFFTDSEVCDPEFFHIVQELNICSG
jgi:DNA helicase IV